jgi:hypothetical protein
MDLVEAAVRTGRRDAAVRHIADARSAGVDAVSERLRMLLHASAAFAAADDDEAALGFAAAPAVDGHERWPFDRARIRLYFGEHLRRGKAPAHARRHLAAATETFQRLGAHPWAHHANQELRACGGPAAPMASRDPAELTPQQREIVEPAAAGLCRTSRSRRS